MNHFLVLSWEDWLSIPTLVVRLLVTVAHDIPKVYQRMGILPFTRAHQKREQAPSFKRQSSVSRVLPLQEGSPPEAKKTSLLTKAQKRNSKLYHKVPNKET